MSAIVPCDTVRIPKMALANVCLGRANAKGIEFRQLVRGVRPLAHSR